MADNAIVLNEKTVRVDPDFEYDSMEDATVYYLETWFDVERKFGLKLEENEFVNLYAKYRPDALTFEYVIYDDAINGGYAVVPYEPSEEETRAVSKMLEEVTKAETGMSAEQFFELWKEQLSTGCVYV